MSQLSKGICGSIALSLTFSAISAIQFASGRDLSQSESSAELSPAAGINRATKTDRAMRVPVSAMRTQTISLRLNGLSDTSVLVRWPIAGDAHGLSPGPAALTRSGGDKPVVACEPVVSVLTEVAKQLQPGRCVT